MNFTATSPTTSANSTPCVEIEKAASKFLVSIYIVAFIFGLIFNVLTLGPIWQQVRRENVLGIFLLSLSISDICFIFTMPLWINYNLQDHQWKLGVMSCNVVGFVYYSNMYISIFLLCCISVDRCIVVTRPLRSTAHRTSRYAWVMCVTVYVVVMMLHITVLFNDNLSDIHDDINNNDRCYETYPLQRPVALFNLIRVGVGFLLPLVVLAVSYWKVLATVGKSPGLTPQVKRKVRLLSFGVIGIFSICFAPYHIMLLLRSLVFYYSNNTHHEGSYCQFEQNMHFFFSCTLALSSLNCVVDPVLYVLVSNGVQEEVKLCFKRRRQMTTVDGVLNTNIRAKSSSNLI
ncbi:hypothetical protein Q5P01_010242 [Channa striata]|uniref:G-protein coupled receptors family 1 profile domain-containing protein n=1 Tax=Channa striata TaxID=64152 RepID=A0AA88MX61_CHASR|nr:hypothetical protein Q5P01_010242 [Channa striata]